MTEIVNPGYWCSPWRIKMKHEDFLKYEEKTRHGTSLLPFVIYRTRIPEGLTYFPTHWHDELELVYVLKGHCTYYVDFQSFEVAEGELLIIPSAFLHSFAQYKDESFDAKVIVFNYDMVNNSKPDICSKKYFMPLFNNEMQLPVHMRREEEQTRQVLKIVKRLTEVYEKKGEAYELRLKMILLEFFSFFFENGLVRKNRSHVTGLKSIENTKMVIAYIEEHFRQRILLRDLADYTGQSVYHLSHMFKKSTGHSPLEYINQYRLSMAARMLEDNDQTILSVAIENGFQNVSYFNRAFKSRFGMTPSEYRNGHG